MARNLSIIKRVGALFLVATSLFAYTAFSALENEPVPARKVPTVAIVQIVEHPALDETYRGIIDELKEQGYMPGETVTVLHETAQGSPVIGAQIAQKFVGIKPDVMVGISTLSAQSLISADRNKTIPIVFSSVTDPVGAQLVKSLKNNEGGNVTGLSNWIELEVQLEKFKEILPGLKKLGFVYNPGEGNAVVLLERLRAVGPKMGIEIFGAPATMTSEVCMATNSISSSVDAIFISNDNTALSAFQCVVDGANDVRIPVFVSDTDMIGYGAVGAVGPNQYQLGRQTGRMVVAILRGASPSSIPVEFPEKTEFHLNTDAMKAINLTIPEKLKSEADKIFSKK